MAALPESFAQDAGTCSLSGEDLAFCRRVRRLSTTTYAAEEIYQEALANRCVAANEHMASLLFESTACNPPRSTIFGERFDRLRESLRLLNVDSPKMVLCGKMDSGKSTLVNRILRFNLVPAGESFSDEMDPQGKRTTRCATVIHLRNGPARLPRISGRVKSGPVLPERPFALYKSASAIAEITEELQKLMPPAERDARYFRHMEVVVTMQAHALPNLTIVDLPGLRQSPLDQAQTCRSIFADWLGEAQDSLWLVTLPASDKPAQALALPLLSQSKPRHVLRVVTRPDFVPQRVACQPDYWLSLSRLGDAVVYNDPDASSWRERALREVEYFNALCAEDFARFKAIGALGLSEQLETWYLGFVRNALPGAVAQLRAEHTAVIAADEALGRPLPGPEARRFALDLTMALLPGALEAVGIRRKIESAIKAALEPIDALEDDESLSRSVRLRLNKAASDIALIVDDAGEALQADLLKAHAGTLARFAGDILVWTHKAVAAAWSRTNVAIARLSYFGDTLGIPRLVEMRVLDLGVRRSDTDAWPLVVFNVDRVTFDVLRIAREIMSPKALYDHYSQTIGGLFEKESCCVERAALNDRWRELGKLVGAAHNVLRSTEGEGDLGLAELVALRLDSSWRWPADVNHGDEVAPRKRQRLL